MGQDSIVSAFFKVQIAHSTKVSHLTLEAWGEEDESGVHHPLRHPAASSLQRIEIGGECRTLSRIQHIIKKRCQR